MNNNDNNKYFDRRTENEIIIANQIKEKNKEIIKQQQINKNTNVKKLIKIKPNGAGFINILGFAIVGVILLAGILIYIFK